MVEGWILPAVTKGLLYEIDRIICCFLYVCGWCEAGSKERERADRNEAARNEAGRVVIRSVPAIYM